MTYQPGRLVRSGLNPLLIAVAAAAALMTALPGSTQAGDEHGPGIAPAHSHAYGKSLTEWIETYWRWNILGADPAQSTVGHVQLMPLPAGAYISGAGTAADPALYRGQLEITLLAGTPFVLPEFAWYWERYTGYPTVPDDVPMADAVVIANVHPRLTFDGRTVLSDANKAAYYVPDTLFDPPVVYAAPTSYGSIAALSFQGVGVVGEPLSVGRHVIHLYETLIAPAGTPGSVPPLGIGVIYDNTWIVTVLPEDLGNHGVAPPDSKPYGKSYGAWGAEWWKWVYSIPAAKNPIQDTTGEFGSLNQSGPVWFLAGTFGTTVERTLTIPSGKGIFFPIFNIFNDYPCPEPPIFEPAPGQSLEAFLAAGAAAYIDQATDLAMAVQVDGVELKNLFNYRAASHLVTFTADPSWVTLAPCVTGTPQFGVSDGYWVMLAPLPKGIHTIHISAAAAATGFNLDVTYTITVGPQH